MGSSNKQRRATAPSAGERGPDAAFLAWLAEGGARVDAGLRLGAAPDGRRGVFAAQALPAGRVVVSIPADMIIRPAESAVAEPLRSAGIGADEFESPRLEREALVLAVVFEIARGAKSRWAPYLAALPAADELHCPVLWSDKQLAWLAGTGVATVMNRPEDDTEELPNMTAEHWEQLAWPLLREHPELGFASEAEAKAAYRHATALVAGYSFGLGREAVQAMVPFWDMLNHASPGGEGVRLHFSTATQTLDMITVRSIECGEEVYNTYGPISNAELLRRYGFVLPGLTNPHDEALLEVRPDWLAALALEELAALSPAAPQMVGYALGLLNEAGVLPAGGCVVPVGAEGAPPPRLLEAVRVLTMDADQLAAFSAALAPRRLPRRAYRPLPRMAAATVVDRRHARRISAVLAAAAQEAIIAGRQKEGGPSGPALKTAADKTRAMLAREVAASEGRCLAAMAAFAERADGPEISGLARAALPAVWAPLVRRRRARLREFLFSPYHKYAAGCLASAAGRRPAKGGGGGQLDASSCAGLGCTVPSCCT